jgi:zinc transport system permease protein
MLEILEYSFMQRALAAGLIIAIIAPMIGIFLVTRRYALMADTLSHVSFAGIALGVMAGINPVISALVVTIVGAICIELLRQNRAGNGEALLSLFLSGSLSIAIILLSFAKAGSTNISNYLFGSITTVSSTDVGLISGLGLLVIVIVSVFYRRLFLLSLDEELAEASGIRGRTINMILIILTAMTVALCMRIVGILLVGALMVIPVLAAMQFTRSFLQTLFLSMGIAVASALIGLVASYYLSLPSGGTIVLATLVFFLIGMLWRQIWQS